jgi:hypothetical protein
MNSKNMEKLRKSYVILYYHGYKKNNRAAHENIFNYLTFFALEPQDTEKEQEIVATGQILELIIKHSRLLKVRKKKKEEKGSTYELEPQTRDKLKKEIKDSIDNIINGYRQTTKGLKSFLKEVNGTERYSKEYGFVGGVFGIIFSCALLHVGYLIPTLGFSQFTFALILLMSCGVLLGVWLSYPTDDIDFCTDDPEERMFKWGFAGGLFGIILSLCSLHAGYLLPTIGVSQFTFTLFVLMFFGATVGIGLSYAIGQGIDFRFIEIDDGPTLQILREISDYNRAQSTVKNSSSNTKKPDLGDEPNTTAYVSCV